MHTVADHHTTLAARIACVGCSLPEGIVAMDGLRIFRMSEALVRRGHQVDIAVRDLQKTIEHGPGLREVPLRDVCWSDYDVVKTVFHDGFDHLNQAGGGGHPFIISKLGSVVGSGPAAGVHFFGSVRESLYATQLKMTRQCRYVTILTEESVALWRREHGSSTPVLYIPTGVDAEIPPMRSNPARDRGIDEPIVLFAGNLYNLDAQPEINRIWQDRLNRLGKALRTRGMRLVAMGPGIADLLDPEAVLHVGRIPAQDVWDWQRSAHVGVTLAQGLAQDNESSKIYYYLRTGLPVVCEQPIPNRWLVEQTGHGVLTPYDDVAAMAEACASLAANPPPRQDVINWIVQHHSWDARAAVYEPVLQTAVAEGAMRTETEAAG